MQALRHLLRDRTRFAALLALALVAKALVPAGWMPAFQNGALTLRLCAGWSAPAPAAPQMHHGAGGEHHQAASPAGHGSHDEQPQHDTSQPCAFAAAGLAWNFTPAGAELKALLPFATYVPSLLPRMAVGRGLAAPPPPATGPPSIL